MSLGDGILSTRLNPQVEHTSFDGSSSGSGGSPNTRGRGMLNTTGPGPPLPHSGQPPLRRAARRSVSSRASRRWRALLGTGRPRWAVGRCRRFPAYRYLLRRRAAHGPTCANGRGAGRERLGLDEVDLEPVNVHAPADRTAARLVHRPVVLVVHHELDAAALARARRFDPVAFEA